MIVHNDIKHLPVFRNSVLTVGTFDGVHSGHRQIIRLMKETAEKVNGETIIITFHPHPRNIVSPQGTPVWLLNTLDEKIQLLEEFGIDHLVIVPFTEAFAELSATAYIEDFLISTFHPNTIIIGHDHRFGKGRTGNYQLLEEKASQFNYTLKEIPGHMLQDITISSTKIRHALQVSDIDTANSFLGYPYFFSGKVIKGAQIGRTIGFATANLEVESPAKLIPANGVYAVQVEINSKPSKVNGIMNIGTRPTVGGINNVIEVHLFDFNEDIYDETLTVYLRKYLRSEQKFDGLDALKKQINTDQLNAKAFFAEEKKQ